MDDTHYVLGTACGPHPFPEMVSYFQSIIGQEARKQILEREGKLPPVDLCLCRGRLQCPGHLSGPFWMTRWNWSVWKPGERDLTSGQHASRLASKDGSVGVAQGYKTYFPAG